MIQSRRCRWSFTRCPALAARIAAPAFTLVVGLISGAAAEPSVLRPAPSRDMALSFGLLHRGFRPTERPLPEDGCHVFLRYRDENNHYYIGVNRRDNTVIVKKKASSGPAIGGTYYPLSGEIPHAVPYEQWQRMRATVATEPNGSVTLRLYSGSTLLVGAVDDGSIGGPPILGAGRAGVYAENADLKLSGIAFRPLSEAQDLAAAPPTPRLRALAPQRARPGSPMNLILEGSGFSNDAKAFWNGSARPAFLQGPDRLIIRLSSEDLSVPGIVPVTVSNPGGGDSNALAFRIQPGILNAEVRSR